MDYFVKYVKSCSPKIRKFSRKKEALDFIARLEKKKDSDNWFDFLIKGNLLICDDYYRKFLNKKK